MSFVETVGKFHISLDGIGLLLQGIPQRPAYRAGNTPVYGARFASGDRDYNDLSQWWYLIQTDWSGGIKDMPSFEDDAKYYYSSNIDAHSELGKIQLSRGQAIVNDFAENITFANMGYNNGNPNRYYGTVKNTKIKVYEEVYNTLGTFTDVISSVSTVDESEVAHIFTNLDTVFFLTVGTTQVGTVLVRKGSLTSDVTPDVDSVVTLSSNSSRAGASINGVGYVFLDNNTDNYSIAKTAVDNPTAPADWTLVMNNGIGTPVAAMGFGGDLYYLVSKGNNTFLELRKYDIVNSVDISVQIFPNVTLPRLYGLGNLLQILGSKLIITVPAQEIWSTDGGNLTLIYKKDVTKDSISSYVALGNLEHGCIISERKAWWGNLVYDGESFYNDIRPSDDSINKKVIPYFSDELDNRFYGEDVDLSKIYSVDINGAVYKNGSSNKAFLIFNNHDKLQSIDKLMHLVTVGFQQLLSGQSISIYYMTDPVPNVDISGWTLLGTASHSLDGGSVTSKTFQFVDGTTPKKIWFRAELASGGTDTPKMTDFTLEYLPMPDYRFQWSLNINCGEELNRLDGRKTETTGRELKARLMRAWQTKSALDFGDIDYTQTLVNNASMGAADTTVTVDSTEFFPEQGRIRIDNEEIYYTNKTPNSFLNCTRGARGTRAATHADNAIVHNGYRVLVIDIDVQVPSLLKGKQIEYIVGLTLREV
jgi:hypothetical protein